MAVAHDAGTLAGNVLTWNHTVAAGSNRALIVDVNIGSRTIEATSVTFDGAPGVRLGRVVGVTLNASFEKWLILSPSTGTKAVVVTLNAANPGCDNGSSSFTGVDPANPTQGVCAGVVSTPATGDNNVVFPQKTGRASVDMINVSAGASRAMTASGGASDSWNSGATGDLGGYKACDGTAQQLVWTMTGLGNFAGLATVLQGIVATGQSSLTDGATPRVAIDDPIFVTA